MGNNDKCFGGSREQYKRFCDQGKHKIFSGTSDFINGKLGLKQLEKGIMGTCRFTVAFLVLLPDIVRKRN